jgi:PadR family transcriptional regulator PadR
LTEPRKTKAVLNVLGAFLVDPEVELYGGEVAELTASNRVTIYSILHRLHKAGWLETRLEDGRDTGAKGPPRKFYRLTPAGEEVAIDALRVR